MAAFPEAATVFPGLAPRATGEDRAGSDSRLHTSPDATESARNRVHYFLLSNDVN